MFQSHSRNKSLETALTQPPSKGFYDPRAIVARRRSNLPSMPRNASFRSKISGMVSPKASQSFVKQFVTTQKQQNSMQTTGKLSSISKQSPTASNEESKPKVNKLPKLVLDIDAQKIVDKAKKRTVYQKNFMLAVDNDVVNLRAGSYKLNNYLNKMVNKRFFKGESPTPILAEEKAVMDSMGSIIDATTMSRTLATGTFQAQRRRKSTMSLHDDGSTVVIQESGRNSEMKTTRMVHKLNESRLMVGGKDLKASVKTQWPAINEPRRSLHTVMKNDSNSIVMMEPSMCDPTSGANMIHTLKQSFHMNAINQADQGLAERQKVRSRLRRRRELAGVEDIANRENRFASTGILEIRHSQEEVRTETDSLANQSNYGVLHEDLQGFQSFYNRRKEEDKKQQLLDETKEEDQKPILEDPREIKKNLDRHLKYLDDVEDHLIKLKANVRLKSTKDFHEDVERKKEEERIRALPKIEIKDKYGRVMERQELHVANEKKKPNENRLPGERPPLVKKKSFVADQKLYHDADNMYDPLRDQKQPTLIDTITIETMRKYQRWPIPESLMNRPTNNFRLKIDSITAEAYRYDNMQEWANYKLDCDAPYNSMESDADLDLYQSSTEEEEVVEEVVIEKENQKYKPFDKKILDISPFRLEGLKYFPYKSSENTIPTKLLKIQKLSFIIEQAPKIAAQQKGEARWTTDQIQNVFDYYCDVHKAPPQPIAEWFDTSDPKNTKFSVKNRKIDDNTTKAIACILPFLLDINEVELKSTGMSDIVSGAIVMAIFSNTSIKRISITYNHLRGVFGKTLSSLMKLNQDKIHFLNIMGSINNQEYMLHVAKELAGQRQLMSLNLAGCELSQQICRILSPYLVHSYEIRELDLSHCKISFQSTRYIIDAVNRNTTIRAFNFSHNDLSSETFEFAIKVASIVTRHPALMHLQIAHTNLKREEVLFIGLALSMSQTLQSLHMTAQVLPYYERVFLRVTIAARVAYQYRNLTAKRQIKSNKEKNQIMQLAGDDLEGVAMQKYVDLVRNLDEQRKGLDFEIHDILEEIDTEQTFEKIDPRDAKVEQFEQGSKVRELIDKMIERQQEIEENRRRLMNLVGDGQNNVENQKELLKAASSMGKLNAQEFGRILSQEKHEFVKEKDLYEEMNALKVDRQRMKADQEASKEAKDRSAGELALMFMGINQMAYELLVENPMTGYMNEIIWTRVLGHNEIETGMFWSDGTQCWICSKWNKLMIQYDFYSDERAFIQKIQQIEQIQQTFLSDLTQQIENLHSAVDNCVRLKQEPDVYVDKSGHNLKGELETIRSDGYNSDDSLIQEAPEHLEETHVRNTGINFGGSLRSIPGSAGAGTKRANTLLIPSPPAPDGDNRTEEAPASLESQDQKPESGYSQPTFIEKVEIPQKAKIVDHTSPVSPIKQKRVHNLLRQELLPTNMLQDKICEFGTLDLEDSYEEQEFESLAEMRLQKKGTIKKERKVKIRQLDGKDKVSNPLNPKTQFALHNKYLARQESSSSAGHSIIQQSVISTREVRRAKGEPMLIEKVVFFEGMVYQIQEEIFSDTDHSSVYTSEDSFSEDDDLQVKFKKQSQCASDNASSLKKSMSTSKGGFTEHHNKVQQNENKEKSDGDQKKGQEKQAKPDAKKSDEATTPKSNKKAETKAKDKDKSPKAKDEKGGKKEETKAKGGNAGKKAAKGKKKNATPLKFSKKEQLFRNSPGLSQVQKEYESTLWPKHFLEDVAKDRIERFNIKQEKKEKKRQAAEAKKAEKQQAEHPTEIPAKKPEDASLPVVPELVQRKPKGEVYCIASFNDWVPQRMKTERVLNLEKYAIDDEDIPEEYFELDDTIFIYGSMVPPGTHYFYLVKELDGEIFLSPKHEVVKFKKTNIYLNRIVVQPKLDDDFDQIFIARDVGVQEAGFMKERSVFKDFREDSEQSNEKCLNQDMKYAKIEKYYKKDVETYERVKECLLEHYQEIINIFDYYCGTSSYPRISYNDMTSFARNTGILNDEWCNLAELDLLLVATNVSIHKYKMSAEKDICRYEILEFFLRTALFIYIEKKKFTKDAVEALNQFLKDIIFPNCKYMNGEHFRKYFCYNVKTNEVLKKNEPHLQKLYQSFTHSKKKYITLEEAKAFVRKLGLNCSDMMLGAMYAESMMTIEDNMSDSMICQKMKYVEFLVFLCRITQGHYETSIHSKELLYLKIDHLMPLFLGHVGLEPIFAFGIRFEAEAMDEYKIFRRLQKKVKLHIKEAEEEGVDPDPKLITQLKVMEKNLRQTGNIILKRKEAQRMKKRGKESSSSDYDEEEGKKAAQQKAERVSLVEQAKASVTLDDLNMQYKTHEAATNEVDAFKKKQEEAESEYTQQTPMNQKVSEHKIRQEYLIISCLNIAKKNRNRFKILQTRFSEITYKQIQINTMHIKAMRQGARKKSFILCIRYYRDFETYDVTRTILKFNYQQLLKPAFLSEYWF